MKPDWLRGCDTVAMGFQRLLTVICQEGANRDERIEAFRSGIVDIRQHLRSITVAKEFLAFMSGGATRDVLVFVGMRGNLGTPLIAFGPDGKVWRGSAERSLETTPDGRPVFCPNQANLLAE